MADPGEGAEAPLLAPAPPPPVAGGGVVVNQRAWLSRTSIKWTFLTLLTVAAMCSIGRLTVGSFSWVSTMEKMDAMAWETALFAFFGDLTTLLLIYSPLDSFLDMAYAGNVGERTHVANVAAVINSGVWVWYGSALKMVNFSVVVTNVIGVLFHLFYLIVYFICSRGRRTFFFKWVAIGGALAMAIPGTCLYLQSAGRDLSHVVGMSGMLTGALMYIGGAVDNMLVAHRTNGGEGKAGFIATSLNSCLWTAYAVVIQDMSMLIPNGIGALLCLCLLIQRLIYFCIPADQLGARVQGAFNSTTAWLIGAFNAMKARGEVSGTATARGEASGTATAPGEASGTTAARGTATAPGEAIGTTTEHGEASGSRTATAPNDENADQT